VRGVFAFDVAMPSSSPDDRQSWGLPRRRTALQFPDPVVVSRPWKAQTVSSLAMLDLGTDYQSVVAHRWQRCAWGPPRQRDEDNVAVPR
jgi:hypothetical protein